MSHLSQKVGWRSLVIIYETEEGLVKPCKDTFISIFSSCLHFHQIILINSSLSGEERWLTFLKVRLQQLLKMPKTFSGMKVQPEKIGLEIHICNWICCPCLFPGGWFLLTFFPGKPFLPCSGWTHQYHERFRWPYASCLRMLLGKIWTTDLF